MEDTQKLILALDLSLNSTGYAVMTADDCRLVEKGIIKAKRKENHHQKLNRQKDVLEGIAKKYEEDGYELIIVKEQLLFRPPKTASILAKVHGIVDLLFEEIHEYYPSSIKKIVTGNGRANKKEVEEAVCKRLGKTSEELDFKSDDESDAIAVALTYLLEENYIM